MFGAITGGGRGYAFSPDVRGVVVQGLQLGEAAVVRDVECDRARAQKPLRDGPGDGDAVLVRGRPAELVDEDEGLVADAATSERVLATGEASGPWNSQRFVASSLRRFAPCAHHRPRRFALRPALAPPHLPQM